MLDVKIKTFVIYITFLLPITIHLARKVQITLLINKKVIILDKYSDFSNMF